MTESRMQGTGCYTTGPNFIENLSSLPVRTMKLGTLWSERAPAGCVLLRDIRGWHGGVSLLLCRLASAFARCGIRGSDSRACVGLTDAKPERCGEGVPLLAVACSLVLRRGPRAALDAVGGLPHALAAGPAALPVPRARPGRVRARAVRGAARGSAIEGPVSAVVRVQLRGRALQADRGEAVTVVVWVAVMKCLAGSVVRPKRKQARAHYEYAWLVGTMVHSRQQTEST